jgi:hypothetical protein
MMKIKTTISSLLFCLCLTCSICFSQDSTTVNTTKVKTTPRLGLALNLGTTPGIDFAYGISSKVAIRLGYSYFKYNVNTTTKSSNEEVKLGGDVNMSILGLSAEYFPFSKSSFKVFGGASYIDKGSLSVLVTPTGTYTFGSTVFTPDQVGNVSFSVDYGKSIAPFAGIGFGRTIPKNRVGFGFEMGTYYAKSPIVTLNGEKRLSSMSEQQTKVQENMKDWHYWPVINLRVAFRLD